MRFLFCLVYICATGFLSFVLGRILPKKKISWNRFPYRSMKWERGGRIYRKLGVHLWHKRLPDMSRILPGSMPAKAITGPVADSQLLVMIQETCVAEIVHMVLIFSGVFCLWIDPGFGGIICTAGNAVGNSLFVVIQRYNRPRLVHLYEKKHQEVAV